MSQRNPLANPEMNQEFFTNLPSEIIINILSRLPVRTIFSCKCVCKSLLGLVKTDEFAKSHFPKSVPGLTVFESDLRSHSCKIFEFEDGFNLEHHELHYNPVAKFDFPDAPVILGSANGLLLFRIFGLRPSALYVCNPITREYINLHCPQEFVNEVATFGFGVSKMTGQHKVVRIFGDYIRDHRTHQLLGISELECQVHTLETRSWRRIEPGGPLKYGSHSIGAFLNGNLHWLVFYVQGRPLISYFDLETELFDTFSSPTLSGSSEFLGLFALGDCLCLCDNTSDDKIVIWLMKEYGAEKSWMKEFVISKSSDKFPDFSRHARFYGVVYPIKVFKDGDILMAWGPFSLFHYSKKNRATQKIDMTEPHSYVNAILHTPSFLSLRSFVMENVISF